MKNNINTLKSERVEVMALFGYEMTPCQPLSFKKRGDYTEPRSPSCSTPTLNSLGIQRSTSSTS